MFNAKLQKAEAKLKLILLGDDRLTVIRRNPSTSTESNVITATRFSHVSLAEMLNGLRDL